MKPGDKVRCVRGFPPRLRTGAEYEIEEVDISLGGVWLVRVLGAMWKANRFELVQEQAPAAPSREAIQAAHELFPNEFDDRRNKVAAAPQKLMDERDSLANALHSQCARAERAEQRAEAAEKEVTALEGRLDSGRYQRKVWKARAEAAEAKLAEQMEWAKSTYAEMRQRAEAAEKALKDEQREGDRWYVKAKAAEARLAECVREVREAVDADVGACLMVDEETIYDILNKYSPSATPPSPAAADRPEHPDKGAK